MKLRILQLHNSYLISGGEDSVLSAEYVLLNSKHHVRQLFFQNSGSALHQAFSLFYNGVTSKQLTKTLDNFKPDVVHIHNLFYTASPQLIHIIKAKGIPIVYTLHNYRWLCSAATLSLNNQTCLKCLNYEVPWPATANKCFKDSRIASLILSASIYYHKKIYTLARVDRFLALTSFQKEIIRKNIPSLNEGQIVVKPNFKVRNTNKELETKREYFLFVGRLAAEKGIFVLMESLNGISTNQKIIVVGEGPLESLVKTNSKQVNYLGKKNHLEVLELMSLAKAIIFPSTWYEGLPMTIIEAFSVGTPVICSNNENLASIVTHGYNGVLFEQGNPQALADAINNFDDLGGQMNKNAYQTYLDRYTAEANLHLLESIYEEVCGIKVS